MKKRSRRTPARLNRSLISFAVASCFAAELAYANPTGPAVASGTAAFSTVGSTLTVTNSPNAIINWQGFSIGVGEATRFQQQSAASAVLNRIVGQDPSAILGTLWSNGRVFLVNPNGVLFGQGSRVDVAGLVASTLNITDADFLGGRLNFRSGVIANSLINQGELHSATGGHIYLIAPDVTNSGLITSPKGEVVLAAGKSVSLVDIGTPNLKVEITAPDTEARNLGQIVAESGRIGVYAGLINQQGIVRADSVSKDATGKIVFRASDTTILDSGSVTSAAGAKGGEIQVLGNKVGLVGNAQVNASGDAGGGTVLVGGDFQGKNPDVQNAFRTYVGPEATIKADAIASGDGGKVILWSDDATRAYGTITARGGAQSGNGGFVEVSGKSYLDFGARVDTTAPHGSTGTLLLDPMDVTIAAGVNAYPNGTNGAAFNGASPDVFQSTGAPDTSTLTWGTIDAALASNNVQITTISSGSISTGNITVQDSHSYDSASSLALLAHNNITVFGAIINAGTGSISMFAGWTGSTSTPAVTPGTGFIDIRRSIQTGGSLLLTAGADIFISPSSGDLTVSASGGLSVSGRDLTITGASGDKVAINVGGLFSAQLAGNFLLAGGGSDGPAQVEASASLEANSVNINATGNITVRGGQALANAVLGATASANSNATMTATTSITMIGADIAIRGGDNTVARAAFSGTVANTGVNVATANANATLSAGTDINISGTNISIRGGELVRAEANRNGFGVGGVNTGTATANANASLSAGGNLFLTATNAIEIRGGGGGFAEAFLNGANGGAGSGFATLNANATLSASNISLDAVGITVRGGDRFLSGSSLIGASANACCNGSGLTAGGNGTGQATLTTNATLTATNDITVSTGTLTIRGGNGISASACCNGSDTGNSGNGTATANSRTLLTAGRDIAVTATTAVLIAGGDSGSAFAWNNGRNGGQGTGSVTLNADAEVAAARHVNITASSLTVRGGDNATGSVCCNGSINGNGSGAIEVNARGVLTAGANGNMTLSVPGGAVVIRGGDNASASGGCCNGGSGGAATASATVDVRTTVSSGGALTVTAGSLEIRGGDNAVATDGCCNASGGGMATVTIRTRADATVSTPQAMNLTVSGPVTIRGGSGVSASACCNASPSGTATVNVTADANAIVSAGTLDVAAGSLIVQGGNSASASACCNLGSALGTANIATEANANALVSAATVTINSGSVAIRGGNNASASACCNDSGGGAVSAEANANASVAATAGLSITASSLTVSGGAFASASACCNSPFLGSVAVTTNANAELTAGQAMMLAVSGPVTVSGGDSAEARVSGGQNLSVTNATGTISAGTDLTMSATSLTVRAGNSGLASASDVGTATLNTAGNLSAGQAMTLNISGPVTVAGGESMVALSSNGGTNVATVNANTAVSAGTSLTITSTSLTVSGGDSAYASASGSGINTATVNASGLISAGGTLAIDASSLTIIGGVQGSGDQAVVTGAGSNTAETIANASVQTTGSANLDYTGGAVTIQGGTARSLGSTGNTSTAQANALVDVSGTTTMNVAGNFDLIGGSALDPGALGSASATASLVGSTSITSSGIISVGVVTGVVSGNSSVTPSMTATPSGSIALNADDINIGPNTINAGTGSVTLGTFSATTDLVFESGGPTLNVLSVTPTDLSNITAGTIVLRAGRDLYLNTDFGTSVSPYDRSVELRAGNNAQITTNSIFFADNRSLTIVADNDNSGAGSLNIGGVQLVVGAGAANTTGNMSLQGHDIVIALSGPGTVTDVRVQGAGAQSIIANNSIQITNSSTAPGSVLVRTDSGTQTIDACLDLGAGCTVTGTGSMLVQGGPGGDSVSVQSQSGSQTIRLKGGLTVQSDPTSTSLGTVDVSADTGQTITAKFIEVIAQGVAQAAINSNTGTQSIATTGMNTSGEGIRVENLGSGPNSGIFVNSSGGVQDIQVNDADHLRVIGQSGGALIQSDGNQTISMAGAASLNSIELGGATTAATSQLIGSNQLITAGTGSQAGAITLRAGTTSGSGTSAFAGINAQSGTQAVSTTGTLTITGGTSTGGTTTCSGTNPGACAFIVNQNTGLQTVTANRIDIFGGSAGEFNRAGISVNNVAGSQQIIVGIGGLHLRGGSGGTANVALISSGIGAATQTITVNGGDVLLLGGSGSSTNAALISNSGSSQTIIVNDSDLVSLVAQAASATISSSASQTLTIQGSSSANALVIGDAASAETSSISGNNQVVTAGTVGQLGSITVHGGTVAGKNAGVFNNSGTQTIATSGTLSLTGGTATGTATLPGTCDPASGSGSCGDISNNGTGLQTVSANAINIVGGSGGVSNGAGIFVNGGPQLITVGAGGLHLEGGTGISDNFAVIGGSGAAGQTLTLNVGGDTTLDASNATEGSGVLIGLGGLSDAQSVTVDFQSTGDLTLTGSDVSTFGAGIGAGSFATNATTNVTIQARNVTLNAGSQSTIGVRIGHANIVNGNGPGDISITATDTIALNDNGTLGSAIRTLGNVTLNTASITQGPNSVIISGGVTTLDAGTISLVSATNDFTGAVNITGTDVSITDANTLTLGAVDASNLTAVASTIDQNSSGVTVSGTSTLTAGTISLTTATNDFGTVAPTSSGNVSITDANAITIGTSSVGGVFDISATSVSFLGDFSASNFSFTGPSYTLQSGTLSLAGTTTVSASTILTLQGGTLNADTIDVRSNPVDPARPGTLQTTSGTLSANTVNVSGTFNDSGGTVSVGTLNVLSGGTLMGTGTITGNVSNSAGTVSPGASAGILTISGNYVQGPSGTLDMQIGGTIAGTEYDQLIVTGSVSLDGTLNTTLINGFVPVGGNTFTLIQSGGALTGTFGTIVQPTGTTFNTFYGPTTFEFIAQGSAVLSEVVVAINNAIAPTTTEVIEELIEQEILQTLEDVLVETTAGATEEEKLAKKPPACN